MNDNEKLLSELRERYEFYYKDLVAYIIWLAQNKYYWSNDRLPGGKKPEDIAQEVIFKTINGDRSTYDSSKGSVRGYLRWQVRSIVDALAKSATHRKERAMPEDEVFAGGHVEDPEEELIEKERQALISNEVAMLFAIADPPLKEIVEAVVLNGCEPKPRFLAEALGTDVTDINKRLKRLRRLAKKGEPANE